MRKTIYLILVVLTMVVLSGCGGSSGTSISELGESDLGRVNVDSLKVSLIGNAKSKYQLDNMKDNSSQILDEVGSAPSDLSNKNNPITMDSGQFYSIDFNFKTTKAYLKGVEFAFLLIDEKSVENVTEDDYHKLLYYTHSGNLSNLGEHSIKANVFISTNIPIGKYALVVKAIDEEAKKNPTQERNVKKLPMSGSVYIDIKKENDAKRAELVDTNGSKYIDLPYTGEVIDGHTNKKAGDATLVIYNTSDKNETLTISAQLELESGMVYDLALLDNNDGNGIIKDEVSFTLPVSENYMAEMSQMSFSYYILENDYVSLVNSLPDLSIDKSSDGMKGEIIWDIKSDNSELVTNGGKNSVLLTKFLDNFAYDSISTLLKSSKELALTARIKPLGDTTDKYQINPKVQTPYNIMDYVDDRPTLTSEKLTELINNNTTNISDIIKIDAATSTSHFGNVKLLHSGKNRVFYKNNKIVAPVIGPPDDYPITSFDKIDAAFMMGTDIYYFRGDQYVVYVSGAKMPPASIWDLDFLQGIGRFDNTSRLFFDRIDAAIFMDNDKTNYFDDRIYFFSGNKYLEIYPGIDVPYRYNMGNIKDKFPNAPEHITAAVSLDNLGIKFFNNLETKIEMTKENIFKYGAKLDKLKGSKKWGGVHIKANYDIKGNWKVPGIEASANTAIKAYLAKKAFNILDIQTGAAANIDKKHPSISDVTSYVESPRGGRIYLKVLTSKIYDLNNLTQIKVTDTLDAYNTRQAYTEATNPSNNVSKYNLSIIKRDWREKIPVVSIWFPAGPVPIHIGAGFEVELSVQASLNLDDISLAPTITTPVNLKVWLSGGANVVLASAGVGGSLTLVETGPSASLPVSLSLGINDSLYFTTNAEVDYLLKLIQGRLYAKFHLGCWFFKWTKTMTLYRTKWLYNRKWTLFNSQIINMNLPL